MMKLLRMLMMPPDCREVVRILQAYLDGELPESQTHVVAEHLRHCERCGIEAEVYRRVKRSLEQLGRPADQAAVRRLRSFAHDLAGDESP